MRTLEEVRQLYPRANYAPDPDCQTCRGEGIWDLPPKQAAKIKYLKTTGLPCPCIYIHASVREEAIAGLKRVAKKGLAEMEAACTSATTSA